MICCAVLHCFQPSSSAASNETSLPTDRYFVKDFICLIFVSVKLCDPRDMGNRVGPHVKFGDGWAGGNIDAEV